MTSNLVSPKDSLSAGVASPYSEACPNPACLSHDLYEILSREDAYEVAGEQRILSYRFASCQSCSLGFVDPTPSADVLAQFYPRDYAYHQAHDADTSAGTRLKYLFASLRHRRLVHRGFRNLPGAFVARGLESLMRRDVSYSLGIPLSLPASSRLLDYGFGSGQWLLTLQRMGYEHLYGYDIAQNAGNVERLRQRGIRVTSEDVACAFKDVQFDCIRLEHVAEHLLQPIAVLRSLGALLRPGGFLVVTVPSIHAWEPVQGLRESRFTEYLQLPIHLWHHSSRSLHDFLAAAGLEVLAVRLLRPFRYLSALARRPMEPDA